MEEKLKELEDTTSIKSKSKKSKLEYLRDKYRQKVRGVFKFYEIPGGQLSFVYKEFPGDPVERYDMRDGEVYEIPLGVAKHLNKNGWYPIHHYIKGEKGMTSMKVGQKVHRFGFQSLEFIDEDDLNTQEVSSIVTIQHT